MSGLCFSSESTFIEFLAIIANFSVAAHMGHSTGGSTPVSQKNGVPTGDRAIVIAAADCDMLCAQKLFVQISLLLGLRL